MDKSFICLSPYNKEVVVNLIDFSKENLIIDGVEVFDVLCPVSSVTGCRENPLALIKTLLNDPAKSRALDQVLMELPVVSSHVKGASYDDMLASLQSVFADGTFYDNDKFAERLMSISEDLLKSQGINNPIEKVEPVPNVETVPNVEPAPAAE